MPRSNNPRLGRLADLISPVVLLVISLTLAGATAAVGV